MHRMSQVKMSPREKIATMLMTKGNLEALYAKDLEIGIYNWTIQKALDLRTPKNWKNPRFHQLYLEKARSILSNLDINGYLQNTTLTPRIQAKECLPHDVVFMNPEQVHPDVWTTTIDRFIKKYENAYEKREEAMTEMFTCGKCKKNKCTFYEKQIRSGDEGMTLFIHCVNCGHKWRQN